MGRGGGDGAALPPCSSGLDPGVSQNIAAGHETVRIFILSDRSDLLSD